MKRTVVLALPLLLVLAGCVGFSTSTEVTSSTSFCASLDDDAPDFDDLHATGYGFMSSLIENESRSDLVLREVVAAKEQNVGTVEYTVQRMDGGEHFEFVGYVIPAGESAMLTMRLIPADPTRNVVVEGVSVKGKAGWSTKEITVIESATGTPFDCTPLGQR